MRLTFALTKHSAIQPVTGLSRGQVTLQGPRGSVTSAGRTPDRSMMVFLAIIDLLDGARELLRGPPARSWEWVCTDSSFSVLFRRHDNHVEIVAMGKPIEDLEQGNLVRAIWEATSNFTRAHPLPGADNAQADLVSARQEFYARFPGPLARSPRD